MRDGAGWALGAVLLSVLCVPVYFAIRGIADMHLFWFAINVIFLAMVSRAAYEALTNDNRFIGVVFLWVLLTPLVVANWNINKVDNVMAAGPVAFYVISISNGRMAR